MPRALLVLVFVSMSVLRAADSAADRAVLPVLQRTAPGLQHAAVIRRIPANEQLDFVVALARQQPFAVNRAGNYWWSPADRLGLFLQDRSDPAKVYRLAAQAGPNDDCSARIERITGEELVLSCMGEKWSTYDNQQFIYDARAKSLVKQFSYPPFRGVEVLKGARGMQVVMSDQHQLLLVEADPAAGTLRVVPAAEARATLSKIPMEESTIGSEKFRTPVVQPAASTFGPGGSFRLTLDKNQFGSTFPVIVERRGGVNRPYPLPQSDQKTWRDARPDDARNGAKLDPREKNEQIGPYQAEGSRLWFGKTFYNSEGASGVGGFGYFDAATRAYQMLSPPEIRKWSVSAILVEADAIWMSLFRRGEYGNDTGGLLRWDRKSEQARTYAVKTIATSIVRQGQTLYLCAQDGIVRLDGDQVTSYFVARSAAGGYRVVAHEGVER